MKRFGILCVGLWLVGACVNSEVTYTGKVKYPSKPAGCSIDVFPSTTPDYKWEDLATVEATCHPAVGRTACVDRLKAEACKLGGDNIYGFKDGPTVVIATVGRRKEGSIAEAIEKQGGTPSPQASDTQADSATTDSESAPAPAAGSCDPPCSPGYKCTEGQCTALCNPPCGEGMRCNQQRMCESSAPPTTPDRK